MKKIKTWQLSSLEKILSDTDLPDKQHTSAVVVRGERFSYQVALQTDSDENSSSFVEIRMESELIDYCSVYSVGTVSARFTAHESRCDKHYITTKAALLPDILYPIAMEKGVLQEKFFLPCTYPECLWIEIAVPKNIKPGSYPVTLHVHSLDEHVNSKSVFTLHIDETVLETDNFKHTQWLHLDCIADYYGDNIFSENHWQHIERFIKTAGEHGISVLLTPVFTPPLDMYTGNERKTVQLVDICYTDAKYSFSFERFHRFAAMAKKHGIRYLEISHLFSQWGAKYPARIEAFVNGQKKQIFGQNPVTDSSEYEAFLSVFLPCLIKEIEKAGFANSVFFHISDEPHCPDIQRYSYAKNTVQKYIGNYPIIDALSEYEFVEKKAAHIPVAAINKIAPFIEHNVHPLWTYYCCSQGVKVSNRFLAMPSWRNRILGILLYKFDIDGFLHWGYNFYYTQYSKKAINPFMVTDAGGAFPAGDAFSVYPGKTEALASIRLKVFYEALQDRLFLKQMEKKLGKQRVLEILEEDSDSPLNFDAFPAGNEYILNLRSRFLNRNI